jgi:hypothetical protein
MYAPLDTECQYTTKQEGYPHRKSLGEFGKIDSN